MDPVRLTIELYIPEPVSNDVDDLADLVSVAVEKAIGQYDYVVQDVGMSFEIQDTF